MEKSIHELKAEFVYLVCVCVCVCARKKLTALISLQSFLRHIRNINLQGVLLEKVFLKKRLWHKCFPVNFAKFLTHFYRTSLGDYF